MAGGTFISQNKVRAGAYINFKAIASPTNMLGTRGVATMPLPLSWGADVIELYSTDLFDGKSVAKIGYSIDAPEIQAIRECLKHCYKLIIGRLDTGGAKAKATIGTLTATAKYAGTLGNKITIKVIANGTKFDVITVFNGVEKDKQTVLAVSELLPNDFVVFTGTGNVTANVGTNLADGTNGSLSSDYTNYLAAMSSYNWDTMGIPQDVVAQNATFIAYIKQRRENLGLGSQIVLYKADTADYEGVISVSQGYATNYETVSPTTFVATMTGITAGSSLTDSNTYKVVATSEDGARIIYPLGVTPYDNAKIIEELKLGHIVLSVRRNGDIVVERDVNTLHTFTQDRNMAYSKNRVIRTLDTVQNDLSRVFEEGFLGKVNNNEDGRNIFKAEVIAYLNTLQTIGAIRDFDSSKDVSVTAGIDIDSMVVNLIIKPVDSLEKLYATVMVSVQQ